MPWPVAGVTTNMLARVSIEGTLHGSQIFQVMWFVRVGELGTAVPIEELQQLADSIRTRVETDMLIGLSAQYVFQRVRAARMDGNVKEEALAIRTGNGAGSLGDSLPSQDTIVINWRTPYKGRSRRGRNGFGGVPEANHLSSQITGVTRDQTDEFASQLLSNHRYNVAGVEWVFIIYSTLLGYNPATKVYSMDLNNMAPVNGYAVRDTVGTVNSRKPGRGI